MAGFIKKIALFTLWFIVGVISVVLILAVLNKKLLVNYSARPHTVFIGDSHMEMGFNDKLFPGSLNLAKSSDGYLHSYAKLKAFLEKENQIRTVVLSFNAHNLSSYFNIFIDGRLAHFGFSDYFPILSRQEHIAVLRRNKLLGFQSLVLVLKKGFHNLVADSNQYSFLGGYAPQPWHLVDTTRINERIREQFFESGQLLPFSDIQLQYLEKIRQLCATHRVKLILLEMPLHQHYRNQLPVSYSKKLIEVVNSKSLTLLQCRQLQLPDSLFLPDGDHVNASGADTTTRYIYTLMNKAMD